MLVAMHIPNHSGKAAVASHFIHAAVSTLRTETLPFIGVYLFAFVWVIGRHIPLVSQHSSV